MFFLNVMSEEFQGSLLLSDRQYNVTFKVKGNSPNSSQLFQAWNPEPFNVSSNKNLTINYSFDAKNTWTALIVDVSATAANTSAARAFEIASALNANATFAALFNAFVNTDNKGTSYIVVRSLRARERFWVYISNGGAEIPLRFNKKAGVAEMPSYFARHTIANKSSFPDGLGMLQQLNTGSATDQQIITEAGLDYTVVHADWELMRGRSGLFNFQNITVDSSDRITQIIEYPAGALAGDLSRKIQYVYSGIHTHPSQITEIPYTLTGPDLVTP